MKRRILTLNVAVLLGLTAPALAQHDTTGEPPGTPGSVTIHEDDELVMKNRYGVGISLQPAYPDVLVRPCHSFSRGRVWDLQFERLQ